VGKYGQESRVWRWVLYSGDSLWRPYVPVGRDTMMMMMMGVVGMLKKDRGKNRSEEKTRKKT
jgi:hypothetical protein